MRVQKIAKAVVCRFFKDYKLRFKASATNSSISSKIDFEISFLFCKKVKLFQNLYFSFRETLEAVFLKLSKAIGRILQEKHLESGFLEKLFSTC